MNLRRTIIFIPVFITLVNSAVLLNDGDVDEQGLYGRSDHVDILTHNNFERRVYGQKHAVLVQFYNSYCGHCRSFAPRYKSLANDITNWKHIVRLAAMDCSVEDNNEICRQFEVMAYPSLRYIHENYVKANSNVGDRLQITESFDKVRSDLVYKLQSEKAAARLTMAPLLAIKSYNSYSELFKGFSSEITYIFVVFENVNSTVGTEIILDMTDYQHVKVERAYETSELANIVHIKEFPGVVVVNENLEPTVLQPKDNTKDGLLKAINKFLKSVSYKFPTRDTGSNEVAVDEKTTARPPIINTDYVYYSDLEMTIRTSLHTEITRYKTLNGEPYQALIEYLHVIINSFPFMGNLKEYIQDLYATLNTKNSWSGSDVYDLVKRLETAHSPVYISNNFEYIRCKGSQEKYRGYTCGLWTLFHTLTVNARANEREGIKILKAMHGYVKYFFGCTECSEHFQDMASRNRMFEVQENDKATLWLWIAHNEVNLRLAGDVTEDPQHPKIQFPSVTRCPECRLARGAWNLPAVYQYLQSVYSADNVHMLRWGRSSAAATSPFSNLDIGMLSLLYILSFVILILVIKYFLSTRNKKRFYKYGRGKV